MSRREFNPVPLLGVVFVALVVGGFVVAGDTRAQISCITCRMLKPRHPPSDDLR